MLDHLQSSARTLLSCLSLVWLLSVLLTVFDLDRPSIDKHRAVWLGAIVQLYDHFAEVHKVHLRNAFSS
jgi:hypothetical protein